MTELQRKSDGGALDPVLIYSKIAICQVLARYSNDLRGSLDRLHGVSPGEWSQLKQTAMNLCHQMNCLKRDLPKTASEIVQEDMVSGYFHHFLSNMKDVHQRLQRLNPAMVKKQKLHLHTSKYFYHKKQVSSLRKRLWRDLTKKIFKKGLRVVWKQLKAEIIDEIARHQIEMQSAAAYIVRSSNSSDFEL